MHQYALIAVLAFIAIPSQGRAQFTTGGGIALRVLSHQALVRSALGTLLPPERRVSQLGIELSLPSPWPALRAEGRLLRSERGSADLSSVDAGLVFGSPMIGVAAAFGKRGSYDPATGLAHGRNVEFGRLGMRLRSGESHNRFALHLRGDTYIPPKRQQADSVESLSGWDAEGGVSWRTSRLPLTASLGYRLERFTIYSVEQEVSALTFSVGFVFGGR